MSRLKIAADGRHFERDGKYFFLTADTAWSAFTNPTLADWSAYLDTRKQQGFNAIQIDILPQWDRGLADGEAVCPFTHRPDGSFALADIPDSYFKHACRMLDEMKARDMLPVLVLLWSNYTNGTFFDKLWGHCPMDKADVPAYARRAAETFKKYAPIYFISGDTCFTDQSTDEYYLPALAAVKETDPEALCSLHICGAGFHTKQVIEEMIPACLLYSDKLDFYTYQSGHFDYYEERCEECARAFRSLNAVKPVMNSEPCYEGWERGYTAYSPAELRRTTWISILSGADAGHTYGAQGIWQWTREGDFFAPYSLQKDAPCLYRCERPFTWQQALTFPGANDRAFARGIMEKYEAAGLKECTAFSGGVKFTKLACREDMSLMLLYSPRNQRVHVALDPDGISFQLIDLAARKEIPAHIIRDAGGFTLDYPGVNNDTLLIGVRK